MKKQLWLVFAALLLSISIFCGCGPKNIVKQDVKLYQPDSSSGLKISLPKTEFKMYEPILVRFDYINKHKLIDTIYHNFAEIFDNTIKFYIRSEKNEIYNTKLWSPMALLWDSPQFFINPGDTLIASMNLIFKYGGKIPSEDSSYNYFGYLEPGRFKFYAYDFIGGEEISSNELSFTVTDLNDEDKKVRDLIKNKNYKEVINNYPSNPFTEHVFINYFTKEYPSQSWDNDLEKIKKSFFSFVQTYPNSFYNLNFGFIFSYFMMSANKINDIKDAISELEKNAEGSLLIEFLQNKYIREKIIKNYYEFKEVIKKVNEMKERQNKE